MRKAWWLFPVAGVLASLAVGGPFWEWVEGQPISIRWAELFSLRAGLWALAFAAIPAVWRIGWWFRPSRPVVLAAVLCVVCGAEGVLRSPLAQTPLWLAARARLDSKQPFMREVCYVRLEEAADREDRSPAVMLVGSSQMLHGVDDAQLRELLSPMPVIRRAMFGMTPLKALAMGTYIPFEPGDVCVQYLSEFDFTNQEEFPFAWFRPYASWRTLPSVMSCIPKAVWLRQWRQVADYAAAATTEWWRTRDFLRHVGFHFLPAGADSAPDPAIQDPLVAAEQARGVLRFSEAEWRAFQKFARGLKEREVGLLVFEGDVNPVIYSAERLRHKEKTRRILTTFLEGGYGRYVSKADQALAFDAGHWRDMSHLNREGCERLTRRIAREVGAEVMKPEPPDS